MRKIIAALGALLTLAGCAEAENQYSAQVRALGEAQVYRVSAPDGRTAAALVSDGQAMLIDAAEAETFITAAPPKDLAAGEPDVAIKAPGLSIEIAEGATEEEGSVDMRLGGLSLSVDGSNAGAFISLGGLSAKDARAFIDDAEDLPPELKAQMKEQVGL